MRKVALKGLAGRKLRTLLTSLAIVLGVAMVTGSFVLTDSIARGFDSVFSAAYARTDAVVTGKKLVDYSASGNATVDEDVAATVRALPEVEAAAGTIIDLAGNSTQAQLLDRDGSAHGLSVAWAGRSGLQRPRPQARHQIRRIEQGAGPLGQPAVAACRADATDVGGNHPERDPLIPGQACAVQGAAAMRALHQHHGTGERHL